MITRLRKESLSDLDVHYINKLLGQLSDSFKEYKHSEICEFLEQDNLFVFGAFQERVGAIVGLAVLKIDSTRMFTQNYIKGYVGDVVVDESFRGKGIARELMNHLVARARSLKLVHINLTSNPNNPKRAAAIRMYEKLGFKLIGQISDSNYYRLDL